VTRLVDGLWYLPAGRRWCVFPGCGAGLAAAFPGRGESGREAISVATGRDRETAEGGAARAAQEVEGGSFAQRSAARSAV